ncbi:hypothetical protein BB559_005072 [Furculomyces boomerangus]|uniref:AMP-dependent synthetase/ligase domain-containing protein n=1 Tax=Furculomyces boomerangus TaxID=61424 RepID=A0A2T9YB42_9FUNG|nr:hypothetical protein BB559_005072 [Furculomyces boomerangus]
MIFKSTFPDLDIPDIDVPRYCIGEGKRHNAQSNNRSGFAIADGPTGKKMDIYEIEKKSKGFASGLANKLGFGYDDVLAIFTPNTIYYPVVFYGTLMVGGVATLVNPNYTARELAYQLKDSNSKAIATQSHLVEITKEAIGIAGLNIKNENIILLDIEANKSAVGNCHIEDFLCFEKDFVQYKISNNEAETKVAALPYSSGTTGVPKGVMLTHKNVVSSIYLNAIFAEYDEWTDRKTYPPKFIGVLPFYHIYGFNSIMNCGISMGVGIVVMPKFDSDLFLQIVQEHRITFGHVVPPIIIGLVNNPNIHKYDLSSMKSIRTGSAPMGKDALAKFYERFKNLGVVRAYGLTETSPTLSNSFKHHENDGSSGVLLNNLEAKVIDENGNLLGYNQIGELCFRGPTIMKGYLNRPDATKETIDEDGFLHTGDLGFFDLKNNLHAVDRIKELIKYKGYQVAPAELEGLLLMNENVADCAVIGIDLEEQATEVPKAYLVLVEKHKSASKEEKDRLAKEIGAWLNQQVAPHKKLRGGVEVLEAIPKNNSGKILRKELKTLEIVKQLAYYTSF